MPAPSRSVFTPCCSWRVQGGAGTSTNMNANEVMANVALELTGHPLGAYDVIEPHDHLNMSQSTNDSYPTALKVAILAGNDRIAAEARDLVAALRDKGDAFHEIVKMGRTELQDAVPMTVGQEFHAFAAALETEIEFLRAAEESLLTINMGATAIGSGINTPEGYADGCRATLPESPSSRPGTFLPRPGTSTRLSLNPAH